MLPLEIRKSAAYDLEIDDKVDFDRTLIVFLLLYNDCGVRSSIIRSHFEVISGVVSDKLSLEPVPDVDKNFSTLIIIRKLIKSEMWKIEYFLELIEWFDGFDWWIREITQWY